MKFSIIIPTYNEEADIGETLNSLIQLTYDKKEILVVDDSTDQTPDIVRSYASMGVTLIRPAKRGGRCEARNLGIRSADGEVIVILNADVRPRSDFLEQLLAHYTLGYDYVLVGSKVSNTDSFLARYIGAIADMDYAGDTSWMEWTEGFSCRRELAIKAGLFPVGHPIPICAGEDGFFGENLRKLGAKRVLDLNIIVDHVAPGNLGEFWQIRKGRGCGGPQFRRFIQRWSFGKIIARAILRLIKSTIIVLLVFPPVIINWKVSSFSMYGKRDLFPFIGAWFIELLAYHVGEWQSVREVMKAEQLNS
ncbi:glycosyltransferase [Candidatus Nitrospira salsa]